MSRFTHRERAQRQRQFSGLLLCLLVVVFALAAKSSWYRVHPPAGKAIASMKAAKADTLAVDVVTHQSLAPTLTAAALLAAIIAFYGLAEAEPIPAPEQHQRPQTPYVRRAFARPPPVL